MNNIETRVPTIALFFSAAVFVFAGCSRSSGTATAASSPAIPVQIAVAQQLDVPVVIESVGAVQALRSVAVKSQVDGMIAEIHFREGDEVKAGELLVALDRRPFENSVRIARADLANARAESVKAEADAVRYKNLTEQEAISKEQYALLTTKVETTRALMQAKEAAVANAELQLGYAEIRAPIAGVTGQLILHEGALVKANDVNQSIVTLNQLAPISAAFSVPENKLTQIRTALRDDSATVTAIDRSSGVVRTQGKLTFVDNSVDPTTGTITLKALFENADHALWPGQYVQVQTQLGLDRGAIVVPTSAVQNGQNGAQVYVVKPDRTVDIRMVKVLRSAGDTSLISEGVRVGETVVTDGQLRLVPGVTVEAKGLAGAAIKGVTTAGVTP